MCNVKQQCYVAYYCAVRLVYFLSQPIIELFVSLTILTVSVAQYNLNVAARQVFHADVKFSFHITKLHYT